MIITKEEDVVLSLKLYHLVGVLSCEVRVTLIVFATAIIELLEQNHCHWGFHFLESEVKLFIEPALLCCCDRRQLQKYFSVFVCFSYQLL